MSYFTVVKILVMRNFSGFGILIGIIGLLAITTATVYVSIDNFFSDSLSPINYNTTSLTKLDTTAYCHSKGGKANESGLKEWCWKNFTITKYSGRKGSNLIKGQLKLNSECSENQISIVDGQIRFGVNPQKPKPAKWCSKEYNYRAELSTAPWPVNQEKGTEEWFGWTYTFGDNYSIDSKVPWLFFQIHEGTTGLPPQVALWCMNNKGPGSGKPGEIHVVNNASAYKNQYSPTGVTPLAGQTVSIVVHVVYGDSYNGLLEVWLDGRKVHGRNVRTVRASNEVGGNAKWGIYKWRWSDSKGVEQSLLQGINHLETFMGPLKIVTRKPGELNYLDDAYQMVAPK